MNPEVYKINLFVWIKIFCVCPEDCKWRHRSSLISRYSVSERLYCGQVAGRL